MRHGCQHCLEQVGWRRRLCPDLLNVAVLGIRFWMGDRANGTIQDGSGAALRTVEVLTFEVPAQGSPGSAELRYAPPQLEDTKSVRKSEMHFVYHRVAYGIAILDERVVAGSIIASTAIEEIPQPGNL